MSCIVFRPISIDESNIVSGPPDAEAQVYDAGDAPFAEGQEVWDSGRAYRSRVGDNFAALTDAASWKDLGEVDYGAGPWAGNGPFDTGEYAVHNHRVWRSTEDGNTDEPASGVASWQDYGPTNRYLAFDEALNRFAQSVGTLKWVLDMPARSTEAVAIFPVGGSLTVTKEIDGTEVFTQTEALVRDSGGWFWNYFNAPRETRRYVIFESMQSAPSERVTITLTGADDATVGLARIAFGFGLDTGATIVGSGFGGRGFARIEFDDFGNFKTPDRPTQKETNFKLRAGSLGNEALEATLDNCLQKPTVAFMRGGGPFGLVTYGLLDDYFVSMPSRVRAEVDVKIQGFKQ